MCGVLFLFVCFCLLGFCCLFGFVWLVFNHTHNFIGFLVNKRRPYVAFSNKCSDCWIFFLV